VLSGTFFIGRCLEGIQTDCKLLLGAGYNIFLKYQEFPPEITCLLKARRTNDVAVKVCRYMTIVSLVTDLEAFQPKEIVEKWQWNLFPLFYYL
jgi:hypothetical protein